MKRDTIEKIIDTVSKVAVHEEIVIVDDFSTGGTGEVSGKLQQNYTVNVLFHKKHGKRCHVTNGISKYHRKYNFFPKMPTLNMTQVNILNS